MPYARPNYSKKWVINSDERFLTIPGITIPIPDSWQFDDSDSDTDSTRIGTDSDSTTIPIPILTFIFHLKMCINLLLLSGLMLSCIVTNKAICLEWVLFPILHQILSFTGICCQESFLIPKLTDSDSQESVTDSKINDSDS